jgi:PadR family transcriptional regulator, regulatory protein AphA
MKKPSTTSFAVLGLLALRPWGTYELATQVRRSLWWFWPRAERKLYDEPKHLVEAGFARATSQQTGNRSRTVYAITGTGREALQEWLDGPSVPPALEFEAMVRVFFADAGTLDQLRRTLEGVGVEARERIGQLQAMLEQNRESDAAFPTRLPINAIAMQFQLGHERHRAEWAEWALEQTAAWRSPTDPGEWDWERALRLSDGGPPRVGTQ